MHTELNRIACMNRVQGFRPLHPKADSDVALRRAKWLLRRVGGEDFDRLAAIVRELQEIAPRDLGERLGQKFRVRH